MRFNSWTASVTLLLSVTKAQQFVMYTPGDDDTAVERMDSIMNPGEISQHVHQIFGAAGMSPNMTYQSLQTSKCQTVADAANHGNKDDKSVYWHPSLYMEALNGTGYLRVPTNGHKIYYRNAGSSQDKLAEPFEFPEGFRMIAGSNLLRTAASDVQRQNITQWICHSPSGMNQGSSGNFPTGVTDCDAVDGFNGAIHFPHCWNGKAFDQANPNAHMSYPVGDVQGGVCPSTHPTRLPHIFVENTFNIHAVFDQVKPDSFVLSNGDPTGYSWHFDFVNGWNHGSIPALLKQCPQGRWGNEDIGTCPNFNASSVPADECKLTTTFVEEVTLPGKFLPGCNPIQKSNPAIDYAAAPLGALTNNCPGAVTAPKSSAPIPGTTVTSIAAPTPPSHPTSTLLTSIRTHSPSSTLHPTSPSPAHPTSPSPAHPSSPAPPTSTKISCPSSNNAQHTASNGQIYLIECGVDHFSGDMGVTQVSPWDLGACIESCAKTKGCVDVSLSGVACYMKSSVGKQVSNGVWGAKLMGGSKGKSRRLVRMRRGMGEF